MDLTTATLPGPAAIERITRLGDPVIRNLQITQCHHELASALASRFGGGANTLDSRSESGAVDWADLPDRVHFICDFFRCHHERADLFMAPFPVQTRALKAGRLPECEL
jgi:hypothetical protein